MYPSSSNTPLRNVREWYSKYILSAVVFVNEGTIVGADDTAQWISDSMEEGLGRGITT